jgi:hypothetical protein
VTPTSTSAANGISIATGFSSPTGLDFAGGFVWVLDRNLVNGAIVKIAPPTGGSF